MSRGRVKLGTSYNVREAGKALDRRRRELACSDSLPISFTTRGLIGAAGTGNNNRSSVMPAAKLTDSSIVRYYLAAPSN